MNYDVNNIIYKRNRHMAIVMWLCSFLISSDLTMIAIGVGISIIVQLLSRSKSNPFISMCFILFLANLYIFFQIYFSPSITYLLFIFVFFSMSVLYLSKTAILLSTFFSVCIGSYFWFRPEGILIENIGTKNEFFNFFVIFVIIGYLFYLQVSLNQSLRIDSEKRRKEAVKQRKNANQTLSNMQATALHIADFNTHLNNNLNEVIESSKKSTQLLIDIDSRFYKHTNNISNIQESFKDTNNSIIYASDSSDKMNELSKMSVESAVLGKEKLENVQDESNKLEIIVNSLFETINNLDKQNKKMLEITKFIINIQNKTNLLALNASIEAARAGEHGLGFSVIAEEIRKLSTDTNKSANQINEILFEFKNLSNKAVIESETSHQIIHNQKQVIDDTISVFQNMMSDTEIVLSHSMYVTKTLQTLKESSSSVLEQIEDISYNNSENTKELGYILEFVQEQQKQISAISDNFQNLEDNIKYLINSKER